jgi:hypothetical protein
MNMETRVLYGLIRKIIMPKYPWIDDFVWTTRFYAGSQYYNLEIWVDPKSYGNLPDRVERDIQEDVTTLFRSVGPPSGVYFDDVTIFTKD